MFRALLYTLIGLLVLTFIRMAAGIITKALGGMFEETAAQGTKKEAGPRSTAGGELKRDPVCGTFVAVSTPFKKTIGGETLHFCSAACRDKHNT